MLIEGDVFGTTMKLGMETFSGLQPSTLWCLSKSLITGYNFLEELTCIKMSPTIPFRFEFNRNTQGLGLPFLTR